MSLNPLAQNASAISDSLASPTELRNWFDRVLSDDLRQLERARRSTVKLIIVATLLLAIVDGAIVVSGWCLLLAPSANVSTTPRPAPSDRCPPSIDPATCSQLKSNPQISEYLIGQTTTAQPDAGYSWWDVYPIPIALFVAILGTGWIYVALVGGAIANYRNGWRAPRLRQLVDIIDKDRLTTYIGQPDRGDLRMALQHSGLTSDESIEIAADDAIAINREHLHIGWSDLCVTIPTYSGLSVVESFFTAIYRSLGLSRQLNFAALAIKLLRAIGYLLRALIHRKLDLDDFSREIISNEGGSKQIFQGLFVQILVPEAITTGQMLILSKTTNRQPHSLKIPRHCRRLKVGNTAFDRQFDTYSADRTIDTQVLSATMQQQILTYARQCPDPIAIAIHDRMLYIAILNASPWLEPKLGQNMLDFAPVYNYYLAVNFILTIAQNSIR